MRTDRRLLLYMAVPALALLAWMGLTLAALWGTLEPEQQQAARALMGEPRGPVLFLAWVVGAACAAFAMKRLYTQHVQASARMAEQVRVMVASPQGRALELPAAAGPRALAEQVNALLAQRDQMREELQSKVAEAARGIEQERTRLAALMSELTQSVVVCNLDGRILLYNNRARAQFRALSAAPAVAGGAELIGLGRSIYAVFDKALVAHALESVQHRLQRGVPSPSTQFVTSTPSGQLLRVQLAAVRQVAAAAPVEPCEVPAAEGTAVALSGFVLMLDNITRDYEQEAARDNALQGLSEGSRAALGNMQAALDMLEYPDLDPPLREQFLRVIRDEVQGMSERVKKLATGSSEGMKSRWPLEDMLGADFVAATCRRIAQRAPLHAHADEVDASVWLKVDSFSLLQAMTYLATRLHEEYEIEHTRLRLRLAGPHAQLDLIWQGQALSTETAMTWQIDPMRIDGAGGSLTVRDVVERHGGEFWFERERVRHEAFFRFLLPLAQAADHLEAADVMHSESRPEYYDFDLFATQQLPSEWDDRRLSDLSYTVFDTETTGLTPGEGDEIIQIGAVRIVNGKLLRHESFEQLVDPQRDIPPAGIPIHGITPEMVKGKPSIGTVLPAFHAFAQDTVLVAHNAAFDMRFLQLKEESTGVKFEQPVLDTLLLSEVAHPSQESHRLEAIAERFGVAVLGRHTAMGDAIVTAEVFLQLIGQLQAKGIHTLGQARAAAQKSYYAKVQY